MKIPKIYTRENNKISILDTVLKKSLYLEPKKETVLLYAKNSIEEISWIYAAIYAGKSLHLASNNLSSVEKLELEKSIQNFYSIKENKINKYDCIDNSKIDLKKIKKSKISLLTSGTTGKAKLITHSIQNFISSASAHKRHFSLNKDMLWLCCLPLYHISGLAILTRALFLNQDFAYEPNPSTENISFWINSNKINGISLVELQLKRLLNKTVRPLKNSSLKYILVGGSAVQDKTIEEVKRKSWPVYLSYGSTEACSQIATTSVKDKKNNNLSKLKILDIWKVKIAGDGEIFLKRKEDKEYFSTGDIGRLTDNGKYLEIYGRKKDIIISAGVNISVNEVKEKILYIKEIKDCFLWGIPDSFYGEKLAMAYTLNKKTSIEKIKSTIKNILHPHKQPKAFYLMKFFPRNKQGKIDKESILKSYSKYSSR